MKKETNSKKEYGILFVFDNGVICQEWYESKHERNYAFLANKIYTNKSTQCEGGDDFVYIGNMLINKSHFLYAKEIERNVIDSFEKLIDV